MTRPYHRGAVFWSFAAIYIIWGSTYLGITFAIQSIPPFVLASSRFILAGGALYLWARYRGEPNPSLRVWGTALVMGSLFFVMGNGLVVWAQQYVPSGRTALLASTTPIWVAIMESALDRWRRPPGRVLAGVVMGMIGLVLLASPNVGERASEAVPLLGVAALVLAAIGWGGGSVMAHRRRLPTSPSMATGMMMIGGGTQLALVAWGSGELRSFSLSQVTAASWAAYFYLILFGSIIGFTAFTYLLSVTTPQAVGTSAYVNPLVAVFLGWSLVGEVVTTKMMTGAAVSLLGVLLIRWPEKPAPPEVEAGVFETGEFPVPESPPR